MHCHKIILRFVLLAVLAILSAARGSAGSLSYTGIFSQDNDVQYLSFELAAPGSVTIQSWGFGGGVNAAGQTIPAGGFATILTLIFPDDTYVYDDVLLCGLCNPDLTLPDPWTGFTGDAYLNLALPAAGIYRLAITQMDNSPNADFLADGFKWKDEPYFTQNFAVSGGPSAPFLWMWDGSVQRTGNWAVDISGDYVTPEPGAVTLAALGFTLLWIGLRRARSSARKEKL